MRSGDLGDMRRADGNITCFTLLAEASDHTIAAQRENAERIEAWGRSRASATG